MTSASRRVLRLILAIASVGLFGCASESEDSSGGPNDALVAHLWDTWGIRINDIEGWDENYQDLGEGAWSTSAEFETELRDMGTFAMAIEQEAMPLGVGTDVTLYVSDLESGVDRYFEYNEAENYVIVGNIDVSVAVSSNPDGSYEVWTLAENADGSPRDQEMTVEDGYAAYAEVSRRNGFTGIAQQTLLTAFAIAHTSVPTARSVVDCGGNGGTQLNATSPPVCTIFQEFCECAACQALQKTDGNCAACPSL